MPFKSGTGLIGATEPNQPVTADNIAELPPGSVVRNGDGSRIIHLHDGIWLWCHDHAHTYDRVECLSWRLDERSVLCHMPPNAMTMTDLEKWWLKGGVVRPSDFHDLPKDPGFPPWRMPHKLICEEHGTEDGDCPDKYCAGPFDVVPETGWDTMSRCAEWTQIPKGQAFSVKRSGGIYVKCSAPSGYLVDVINGTMPWAPSVIDFLQPLSEQIVLGTLVFKDGS